MEIQKSKNSRDKQSLNDYQCELQGRIRCLGIICNRSRIDRSQGLSIPEEVTNCFTLSVNHFWGGLALGVADRILRYSDEILLATVDQLSVRNGERGSERLWAWIIA